MTKSPDKTDRKSSVSNLRRDVLVCLLLVIAIIVPYRQVKNCNFIDFDDDKYITENAHVKAGLTKESIKWALTETHAGNWHPLTWMSHMLDVQLFGMNAGRHHLTNLIFHIANSLLLFLVLKRMTYAFWPSFLVATLFAVHPLNVESVAWVAERKNVLSTLFWILTMGCYTLYVERPSAVRYTAVFLFLMLGLAAKPMLVTLPLVLILLDYWPLARLKIEPSFPFITKQQRTAAFRLFVEKIPFLVLITASCIVTFWAEKQGAAVVSLKHHTMDVRIANALVSYAAYIGKMFWPVDLAFFYPLMHKLPGWEIAGAFLQMMIITFIAIRFISRHPYFIVGWLWYLGTLVPVIGIIQVGMQARADRYAYVPTIGLFIIIAWGLYGVAAKQRNRKIGFTLSVVLCSALMVLTGLQVRYWADSHTLYGHALKVTKDNMLAHYNLGTILAEEGKTSEAIQHYNEALRIMPDYAEAHNNLGNALISEKRIADAIDHYRAALRIYPNFAVVHNNLGIALEETWKPTEAMYQYAEALQINPNYFEAHMNLGSILAGQGKTHEAVDHYQKALSLKPDATEAMYHLAKLYIEQAEYEKALTQYQNLLNYLPDNPAAYYNIACIYSRRNQPEQAVSWLQKAVAKGFYDWEHITTDSDLDNIRNSSEFKMFLKGHYLEPAGE